MDVSKHNDFIQVGVSRVAGQCECVSMSAMIPYKLVPSGCVCVCDCNYLILVGVGRVVGQGEWMSVIPSYR